MRQILLIVALLVCFAIPGFAQDLNEYQGYQRNCGEHYRHNLGNTYQKYNWGMPDFDRSLRKRRDRLQVYKNSLPQYGNYYKKRMDGSWQKYENYLPKYGDKLEPRLPPIQN